MSNYAAFRKELQKEIKALGRDEKEVRLIAASKYFNADEMREIYRDGQSEFGENRLNEAVSKMEALKDLPVCWHFFGHVQTNKTKKIVENFSVIHSLDSIRVAMMVDKYCAELKKQVDAFIQVNIAGEDTKSGYEKSALMSEFKELISLRNLKVLGLMTITPLFKDPADTRPLFSGLRNFMEELNRIHKSEMKCLSMGMTNDWKYALREGATHLRVGRALI